MGVYGTWVSRRLLAQVNSRLIEICNSRFLMLSLGEKPENPILEF